MMNEVSVKKAIMFVAGWTSVHIKESSSQPSVVTDKLKVRIEIIIQEDKIGI